MTSLASLFHAERIKWKRNWATVAAILCPASLVGFLFLIFWNSEIQASKLGPGFQVWYQVVYSAWNLIFMPITVALVCLLSWEQEEAAGAWKHLLLQPVPRRFHYLAKCMSHAALMLMAQLVLFLLVLLTSLLISKYLLYLDMGPPKRLLFTGLGVTSFLASLPLLGLHTWLSTRIRGVGSNLTLALVGSLLTVLLASLGMSMRWSPWALSGAGVRVAFGAEAGAVGLLASACGLAILLVLLGAFDFSRREEQR
ncbi:MAG: ABC transporter permease [Geothrix sp.]|uniref:ABC transporter permease n=1 Tax=Geothrix sp. TaxID=1962974 RepID=UPI001824B841|nr:ABC transporter permease [Geothrix sp.]NWJ42145.1 ABC transporter permease [Geothrix sp.]WIL19892.1 MAG: ABC transporter permease [Geothrix sp.]